MKLPRFTVRRQLVAVALVGIALGAWWQLERWRDLRIQYETEATDYSFMEISAEINGKITHEEWLALCQEIDLRNRVGDVKWIGDEHALLIHPPSPEVQRRRAAHYARMKAKYLRAARHPWLHVEPDPPEPK